MVVNRGGRHGFYDERASNANTIKERYAMSRTHRPDNVGIHQIIQMLQRPHGKCPCCNQIKPMHWISQTQYLFVVLSFQPPFTRLKNRLMCHLANHLDLAPSHFLTTAILGDSHYPPGRQDEEGKVGLTDLLIQGSGLM